MAEMVVFKWADIGRAEYEAVNDQLGIDVASGEGEWPAGLLAHSAGTADDGTFVVVEVWKSRHDQGEFMGARLGGALAAGGVNSPPDVIWVPLLAHRPFGA